MSEATAVADKSAASASPEDINKLRSIKDQEVAAEAKRAAKAEKKAQKVARQTAEELANLRAEVERLRSGAESDQTLSQVQQRLGTLKTLEDKERALDDAIAAAVEASRVAVQFRNNWQATATSNKANMAKALALELVAEHGGDFETFRRRLMAADTDKAMEAEAKLITAERLTDTSSKKQKKAGKDPATTVDRGRGNASRSSVLEEMNAIDVTTPEGRREFAAKEREFKKKIAAS
ncbi:MAG: hypothetical protein KGL39_46455 [Patescibacteria group bacterium]|nr:hypothetical protein [Patescibacteria group bacterium]